MGQAYKPSFWQIAAAGLVSAITFAFARYFRMEGGATNWGIGQFLVVIGWLSGIGAIILMLVWAAKTVKD